MNRIAGSKRVFVATWMEGRNFGDDYLSIALSGYLKREFSQAKVYQVNLRADGYRLTDNDIIIVGGGGLWGPSGTGHLERSIYEAWVNTKSNLIIANIGIESFDPLSAEQLIAIREKASLFSVRDRESWLIAKHVLGENRVLWGADNTYLNPIYIERHPVKGRIAVNLCGPEQENGRRPYSIKAIVESISRLSGLGYMLKGVVFTYQNALTDHKYCRLIDPTCTDNFSIGPYRDCELFVGMHFHSIILALQNCVPVIAINYSDKVKRVMQEYGLDEYCLEPDDPELFEKMLSLLSTMDKSDITNTIREGNESAQQRLIRFENELDRVVNE